MRRAVKFLMASTVSLLLLPLITVSLLLHFIEANVFEPKALQEHFAESGLFPVLTATLHERLQERAESGTDSAETKLFMKSIREAVKNTVSDEWLKERMFLMQTSLLNFASGKSPALDSIPIADLRSAMLESIKQNFTGPDANHFPKEEIDKALEQLEKMIPSSADLVEIYKVEDGQLDKLIDIYNKKEQARALVWSLLILLAGLGIVISFYATYLLRWLGFTLGGIGMATYIGYRQLERLDLYSLIDRRTDGAFGPLQESFIRTAEHLVDGLSSQIMRYSLIMLAIGLILVIIGYLPWVKSLANRQKSKLSGAKYFWIRFLLSLLLLAVIGWQIAETIRIFTA